jgi:Protein of unknwon function (DUF3310)
MTENFESNYESFIPEKPLAVSSGAAITGSHLIGGMGEDHISFNYNNYWDDNGFSLTGNPYPSPGVLSPNSHTASISYDNVVLNSPISKNHLWKYNEDQILKDVSEYVTSTYGSHYCGQNQEYKNIQTIDLMAAKDLAQDFCQANILKYGSRYGAKNGRNKSDLLKVIHYAMLLLHFDGHYTRKDNGLSEFKSL